MARRPVESQLYRELVDACFNFIERGTREINEIYDAVKRQYPHLCDDDFSCVHQRNAVIPQSEWKHVARGAMQRCKLKSDSVSFTGRRGLWIFT